MNKDKERKEQDSSSGKAYDGSEDFGVEITPESFSQENSDGERLFDNTEPDVIIVNEDEIQMDIDDNFEEFGWDELVDTDDSPELAGPSLVEIAKKNFQANHADFIDEFGVRYNGLRDTLIEAPQNLSGQYTVASGTKVIGDGAFYLCQNLEHIELPHSIRIIEKNAFNHCGKLHRIVFPENISKIGDYAFYDCRSLSEVSFNGIPNDLGICIFTNCENLSDVQLRTGMKKIGNCMFDHCTSLATIHLPESITELEPGAFNNCTKLKEVTLPDSLEKIGGGAFMNCTGLNVIRIPASVQSIGPGAFAQTVCKIEIEGNRFSFGGRFLKQDSKLIACLSNDETILVPDNIDTIASGCFCKDDDLRTVILPMSVKKVDSAAFLECRFLEEITIMNPNIQLRADFIEYCPSLKKINLPSNASLPLKNLIRRLF